MYNYKLSYNLKTSGFLRRQSLAETQYSGKFKLKFVRILMMHPTYILCYVSFHISLPSFSFFFISSFIFPCFSFCLSFSLFLFSESFSWKILIRKKYNREILIFCSTSCFLSHFLFFLFSFPFLSDHSFSISSSFPFFSVLSFFISPFPGENFSQNFSYNFSEFRYNFITFSHFFIQIRTFLRKSTSFLRIFYIC